MGSLAHGPSTGTSHARQSSRPPPALPPLCLLGAGPGERRGRRPGGQTRAGEGGLDLRGAAGVGLLRPGGLCGRGPGGLCALRPGRLCAAVAGLPDQSGVVGRRPADDGPGAAGLPGPGHRPGPGADRGEGSRAAERQGDRGVRRREVGGAVLRAAGRPSAGGRLQDGPAAPAVPPAAAGAALHDLLEGGRRDGHRPAAGRRPEGAGAASAVTSPLPCSPADERAGSPSGEPALSMFHVEQWDGQPMKSDRSRTSAAFGLAPTMVFTTSPPL
ncbi:hypothetical protein SBRY_50649 [Actinacidiphila bryophytorum]|uniref:Uncharacterized protein n=1 Tax=Actinacidiphila bryophytorum TaxID=1436133 RepID=A0A9W4H588_9ACTN|nr:hypothetical protein SBRY_50649 [Actinacidiphila bryophytorum]